MDKKNYRVSARVTEEIKKMCIEISKKQNITESDLIIKLLKEEYSMLKINKLIDEYEKQEEK